jgi:hypothetical protein
VLALGAEARGCMPALRLDHNHLGPHFGQTGQARDFVSATVSRSSRHQFKNARVTALIAVRCGTLAAAVRFQTLEDVLVGGTRPILLAFSFAVVLVLLIAAANAANLFTMRNQTRRTELAVRTMRARLQ